MDKIKINEEYSEIFDGLRKNRAEMSYYKYGSAKKNYKNRLSNPLVSLELCVEKYKETHNTEYLCDAANYLMFEFMYPQFDDAHFKATSSDESAGRDGITYDDLFKED